ncbi:hypothetical protein GYH30_028348 [Glycine max]|uniref:ADP-ribosylation factor-like protein 5 n=2 Tax=Glycine subgen. Soja TaxID=1462606 RepID=K7LK36_SOYBN|nr:hypothetical protein GYH30_028348 [Glycine max]RZB87817.1 ADP-ribosylation factor-like protein 5 [Glycine soja]
MGAMISRFWFMLFPAKEYKIVVVGLDNAGKTTTLYKLHLGTNAVIAVIDSSDRTRITIIKDELFRLLGHEDLQHSVILVFANKQDIKDAMTPAEITDALSLHSIKDHDWHIQTCCALLGEGLYDGLGWIAQRVTGNTPR